MPVSQYTGEITAVTYEDFQQASIDELKRHANDCFTRAYTAFLNDRPAYLLEAQFYIGEIDRRESEKERKWTHKIAWRDVILEVVIICLIGWEIREGNKQATVLDNQLNVLKTMQANAVTQTQSDAAMMDKQNGILSGLQRASDATALAMKNLVGTSRQTYAATDATAKSLRSLQSTTEAMSKATQGQLELLYDVTLNVYWNEGKKQIEVANTGRTNVTIGRVTMGGTVMEFGAEKVLAQNGLYDMQIEQLDTAIAALHKGVSKSFPLVLYLKNARQEEFVLSSNVDLEWQGEKVAVRTQTLSIRPERWSTALKN